jgi:membrane protease YdiL (CAAX protease family)
MEKKNKIALWKVLIVLVGFPLIYQIYSLSFFATELFVHSNQNYWIPFFGGVIFIHWLSYFLCRYFLKKAQWDLATVGYPYTTSQTWRIIFTYFLVATLLFVFVEYGLFYSDINVEKLKKLNNLFPKTTAQRVVFILIAFSAGFCEEFVYRGFGIRALESLKVPLILAVLISTFSFSFIHGVIVFERFFFYFIPGLLFAGLFIWTKKLEIPILTHAFINLSAMLMILRALA